MKIKVIGEKKEVESEIKRGQLWKHSNGMVCIVAQVESIVNEEWVDCYVLIDLEDGVSYGALSNRIEEIFLGDKELFVLVKESELNIKM